MITILCLIVLYMYIYLVQVYGYLCELKKILQCTNSSKMKLTLNNTYINIDVKFHCKLLWYIWKFWCNALPQKYKVGIPKKYIIIMYRDKLKVSWIQLTTLQKYEMYAK